MQRTIKFNRRFNLGNYQHIDVTETVTFEDDDFSDVELDEVRAELILDTFSSYAAHQKMMQEMPSSIPDDVREYIEKTRDSLDIEFDGDLVDDEI